MIHPLYQWVNFVRREVWKHARQIRKEPYLIRVFSSELAIVEYVQDLFSTTPTPPEWITLPPLDRQPWYQGRIHHGDLLSIIVQCRRASGIEPTLGTIEAEIKRRFAKGAQP